MKYDKILPKNKTLPILPISSFYFYNVTLCYFPNSLCQNVTVDDEYAILYYIGPYTLKQYDTTVENQWMWVSRVYCQAEIL
jgi:hypothetical protein